MQHQVRQAQFGARRRSVRGDSCRERVGGVDDGGDVIVEQPGAQSLDATEAADAHRADRQCRVGHPTGQ